MKLYNTMTRKKEEFVPITPGEVKIYACGPTVYNYFHIGNARPFIIFDTLRRYFEYRGNKVVFVQNFTDIDDRMIQNAALENTTVAALAEKFIAEYYVDADSLGVERATFNPRATEHIPEIIELVAKLIEKGHAYAAPNGDVYYSTASFAGYGKLCGQNMEELMNGARVAEGEVKREATDFALWKAQKPGEPAWESPWGPGRPGWHIECSAMSMKYLGKTFDIHAGGVDLVFPHHENEIAQSEGATDRPFARYWLHNGHINVNNEKMSKSANNFFMVRDIAREFDLEAVRLFMLGTQYRNPINFSRELVEQAKAGLDRLKNARAIMENIAQNGPEKPEEAEVSALFDRRRQEFIAAMDDDLNTADALGVLYELVRDANTRLGSDPRKAEAKAALAVFDEIAGVLGVARPVKNSVPEEVLLLSQERQQARKAKDWALSDKLRAQINGLGYAVEDGKEGPVLKKL